MDLYTQKHFDLITLGIIIFGGVILGLRGFFNFNLIQWISSFLFPSKFSLIERTIYIMIGISVLVHIFSRNYYLPFLGDAVYPCGSLNPKFPDNTDTDVIGWVTPNSKVVYWAAESNKDVVANYKDAYFYNTNAGITTSDPRGKTIFKVRKPASYYAGSNRLNPHIHYRACKTNGMLGPIKTIYVDQEFN